MTAEVESADAKYVKSLLSVFSFFISGVVVFGGIAGFLINSLTTENIDPQVRSIIALSIKASLIFFGSFTMASIAVAMLETSVVFSKYEDRFFNKLAEKIVLAFSIAAALISIILFLISFMHIKPIWERIGALVV